MTKDKIVALADALYDDAFDAGCFSAMDSSRNTADDKAERLAEFAAALTAQPAAPAVVEDAEPSDKQAMLMELADRIDHEQLWRWPGMHHHKMTPEQRDRYNAGVELRRYALYWKADRWLVIPPVGPVRYSASTLEKAAEMAQKGERRRSSTPPEGPQP